MVKQQSWAWMRSGALMLLALAVAGCATLNEKSAPDLIEDSLTVRNDEVGLGTVQKAPDTTETAPGNMATFTPEAYRIGPGDVLKFQSFNDESFSGDVEVRYDGFVSLPLVPDIKVQGLTREKATELVQEAYGSEFIEPRVSLSIRDSRSKSFHVMGDVARPSEYPYRRPITIINAINLAGGIRQKERLLDASLADRGEISRAFIIRHQEGERHVMDYDLRGLDQDGAHVSDTLVYPGDIIYVPKSVQLAYVMGEVRRPLAYKISEGMNVLELLALAGGPNEATGRLQQVVLMHQLNDNETRIELVNVRALYAGMRAPEVFAGDVVYVPRKRLAHASQVVNLIYSTISPALDLYMKSYAAYYTKDRYDLLYRGGSSGDTTLLTIEQLLQDLISLSGTP